MPPLLIPLLALAVGIVAADLTGAGFPVGTICAVIAVAIALAMLAFSRRPSVAMRLNPLHRVWTGVLFLSLGIMFFEAQRPGSLPVDRRLAVSGEVTEIKQLTSGLRATVRVDEAVDTAGNVYRPSSLKGMAYFDLPVPEVGDTVSFTATASELTDSPNRLPTGYARQMHRQGILYSFRPLSRRVEIKGHHKSLTTECRRLRDDMIVSIERLPLERPTKNFIITLLLGDRTYLDPSTRETFSDAGVAHILALSGMHVGIISSMILFLLFPLNLSGRYKWRYLLTVLLLWIYVALTGFPPTAVRAAVMASFGFTAIMLERRNSACNALCGALILILLVTPSALFEIGLQLSVACVASLTIFGERLNPVNHHEHPRLFRITAVVVTTLVATLSTWMITAYYFHQFPLSFLPANLVALPLLPWWIGCVVLFLFTSACGLNPTVLGTLIDNSYKLFSEYIEWVSRIGGGAVTVHAGWSEVLLWTVGILILWGALEHHESRKILFPAGTVCCLAAVAILIFLPEKRPEGYIVCNTSSGIELTAYSGGTETPMSFTPGKCSIARVGKERIVVIDGNFSNSAAEKLRGASTLIVGRNYRGELDELYEFLRPGRIVIHRTVYPARERHLINHSGVPREMIHSLRSSGPLYVFDQ